MTSESQVAALATEAQGLTRKLRWLTIFRACMVTVLLLASLAFDTVQTDGLIGAAMAEWGGGNLVAAMALAVYVLTLPYVLLLRWCRSTAALTALAFFQLLGDVILAAVLVRLTGGTDSAFTFFFSLNIINAAIILYRPGAFVLASASTLVFVTLALGELGHLPAEWMLAPVDQFAGPRNLSLQEFASKSRMYNLGVNTFAFFAVAALASSLAEQVRRTDRERAAVRSSLEELRALHRNIVSSVMSGLVTVTSDGHITFFNRVAERLTGRTESAVLGRSISDVFPNLDFHSPDVLEAATYPSTQSSVEQLNGEQVYLRWSISPLLDANENRIGHVLFLRDISKVLEMEKRMRRAEQLATVGRLAASVAHDIRNPLTAIQGAVQLLGREVPDAPRSGRLMGIIEREVSTLNAWITQLLEYSSEPRIDAMETDACAVIRETVEAFRQQEGDVVVHLSLPEDESSLWVRADPQRLKQVFWNLIKNGAEAMPDGGVVRVSAFSEIEEDRDVVVIEVRDYGGGIADDAIDRIFQPFYTTKASGTGLGLATSQRIVEAHGGTIRVESAVADGSVFAVELPRAQRPAALRRPAGATSETPQVAAIEERV